MTKGDVHALNRIEKTDRRTDRAARRLVDALAKTNRNKRRADSVAVTRPAWSALSFALGTHIMPTIDIKIARRRLHRTKVGNRRVFLVGEVFEGLETVVSLLVVPKHACASAQALADAVCKEQNAQFRASASRVLLFCSDASSKEITTGSSSSTHVFLRKVTFSGSQSVFYASAEDSREDSASPRALHLDENTYGRIQKSVARMIGAQITPEVA